MSIFVAVQNADFSQEAVYQSLASGTKSGAVVTFVGRVREFASAENSMLLQHYPGMTESVLENIAQKAKAEWGLEKVYIIHRVGKLAPGAQIVIVGVSAPHRQAAFAATQYIMDILKTTAPFWKKEGDTWVAAKNTDNDAAEKWQQQQ